MQSIDRIETFETDAKALIGGTKCKDRVAVTISGGRFLAGGQEGGAWIRQEVRGTERIQRIQFWHGSLVHRLVAHGHENPRDTDSWATSHRETARDRHIRAARFTTIKMGAVGSAILFSPVNNAVDRIIAIFDFQSASVLFLFLSFPFFQPPPPSPILCIEESIRFIGPTITTPRRQIIAFNPKHNVFDVYYWDDYVDRCN